MRSLTVFAISQSGIYKSLWVEHSEPTNGKIVLYTESTPNSNLPCISFCQWLRLRPSYRLSLSSALLQLRASIVCVYPHHLKHHCDWRTDLGCLLQWTLLEGYMAARWARWKVCWPQTGTVCWTLSACPAFFLIAHTHSRVDNIISVFLKPGSSTSCQIFK